MEEQLERLLGAVREVLGEDLVGAYLHGSAVLGGLRPCSDLDVLVVARRRMALEEKRSLVERLLAVSGPMSPGPLRPVEMTVVAQPDVRPWRYPPSFDLQYGEWLRAELESGDVEPLRTTVNPDVTLLITMARLGDTPLLGRAPAEVFDPVPREDFTSALLDGIDGILDEIESDTRNMVLTLARIWSTAATDVIRSKDAAADWALARLPDEQRPVLARARAIYLDEEDERWDGLAKSVRPFADHVVGEIERVVRERRTPGDISLG